MCSSLIFTILYVHYTINKIKDIFNKHLMIFSIIPNKLEWFGIFHKPPWPLIKIY